MCFWVRNCCAREPRCSQAKLHSRMASKPTRRAGQIIAHGSVIAAAPEGHGKVTVADDPALCVHGTGKPKRSAAYYSHEQYGRCMILVFEELPNLGNSSGKEKSDA